MTPRQWLKRLVPQAPRRPKPPRQPDPGESLIQERLTPLVEALVHPDESCRRAAVEHVSALMPLLALFWVSVTMAAPND
jgi:hypothetical protein